METAESELKTDSGHLEMYFYRVPKKNREAVEQNLKKFVPWFKQNGIGIDYFRYVRSLTMEGMEMENIAKTFSVEDEDLWVELQHFRDQKHCDDSYAKMMKDESLRPLGEEFFGLIAKGKGLISGGFGRLKV